MWRTLEVRYRNSETTHVVVIVVLIVVAIAVIIVVVRVAYLSDARSRVIE